MARRYQTIKGKGWTCVSGALGIHCHRDKAPVEGVSLYDDEALIVDAVKCKSKTTLAGRRHTICKFKKR